MILNNPIKDHKGSGGCVPRALRAHLKGFCAEAANVFLSAGELQELALLQPLVFPAQCLTSKQSMLVSQKKHAF